MNTLYYKYAVEVERLGSITQAADTLYMAQPNLSKAIKELEDSLGISIFKRTSKGVIPTQKGAEFLVYAKNILTQIEKMEALNQQDDTQKQYLNISLPYGSYLKDGFIQFIKDLEHSKEIEICMKEAGSIEAINNILYDKFDLGVIRYQTVYETYFLNYLKEKELNYDLIWEFDCLAIMSANHKVAYEKTLLRHKLADCLEILPGDTAIPYISSGESPLPDSNHIHKTIYVGDQYTRLTLLSSLPNSYMWSSPLQEELLHAWGVIQRKCIDSDIRYKDVLIYPKGYSLTSLDRKLIDKLYMAKNQVAFYNFT